MVKTIYTFWILLFSQQILLTPNWKNQNAPACYSSAWLTSRTYGRWRELTHSALAGCLSWRARFLDGGQLVKGILYTFFLTHLHVFLTHTMCRYNLGIHFPYKYPSNLHHFSHFLLLFLLQQQCCFFHPWPFIERGLFENLKIWRGFFELETRGDQSSWGKMTSFRGFVLTQVEVKQQECKGEAASSRPHFENCCCHEAVPWRTIDGSSWCCLVWVSWRRVSGSSRFNFGCSQVDC